jgi:glutathione S-transferase
MTANLIHHGVMFSYYSAKTRAYLGYKRIPFLERYDGNDMAGRIREVTNKIMIPVVEMPDGEILQDTTVIIDTLEDRYPERPVLPSDAVMLLLTRIVEFVMDELWISTAMNSRWNDPVSNQFVVSEFGLRIAGSMGLTGNDAVAMGERVAGQMQSYLPLLGVSDKAGQAAATAYFEEASLVLNDVVSATGYAFGPRPTLIDFCLFTGYYAHQYRDVGTAQTFLKTRTPRLCYFLDNLHAAWCAPDSGDLNIPNTLIDYLSVIGPAGAEFAAGIVEGTAAKAADTAGGSLFEAQIEPFDFKLGEQSFTRGAGTFSAWKAQRVHDIYLNMDDADRQRADEIAAKVGWGEFLKNRPDYRLERRNHLTHLA